MENIHRLFSEAEGMSVATSGVTPLVANLESSTAKFRAGGSSKDCVPWKICAVFYIQVRSQQILLRAKEKKRNWRGEDLSRTSSQVFENFQASGGPGKIPVLHIQGVVEKKRYLQGAGGMSGFGASEGRIKKKTLIDPKKSKSYEQKRHNLRKTTKHF